VQCACVHTIEFYHFILRVHLAKTSKCFVVSVWYFSFSLVSVFKVGFCYHNGLMYFLICIVRTIISRILLMTVTCSCELRYI
jgi:hypothetical protein